MNLDYGIDIGIVALYFIVCICVVLHKHNTITTLRDYTLGNRYMSDVVLVSTILSTSVGAGTILVVIQRVYQFGIFYAIPFLCIPFNWLIAARIYGKNINQFYGSRSVSDIMEVLYGKIGRWVTTITGVFLSIAILTVQATVLSYLLNYFFQIPTAYGTIASIGVLTLFSVSGGIRAIAVIDIFWLMVLIVIVPMVCSHAYHNFGGYSAVKDALPQEMLTLNLKGENLVHFLYLITIHLIQFGTPPLIQRCLTANSPRQLVRCFRSIAIIYFILIITMCCLGFVIKALAPDINPETVFIHFIANHLSVGMKGLVITGLLAVIMSTADAFLTSAGMRIAYDITERIKPPTDKQSLNIARLSIVAVAILATCLSFLKKDLIGLFMLVQHCWFNIITVPLIAGFLKLRTNHRSFIASIVMAVVFTCIGYYTVVGHSAACSIIGSSVGLFGMHYWQKYQETNHNKKYTKLPDQKQKSEIGYANSAEQIAEWCKEVKLKNKNNLYQ